MENTLVWKDSDSTFDHYLPINYFVLNLIWCVSMVLLKHQDEQILTLSNCWINRGCTEFNVLWLVTLHFPTHKNFSLATTNCFTTCRQKEANFHFDRWPSTSGAMRPCSHVVQWRSPFRWEALCSYMSAVISGARSSASSWPIGTLTRRSFERVRYAKQLESSAPPSSSSSTSTAFLTRHWNRGR